MKVIRKIIKFFALLSKWRYVIALKHGVAAAVEHTGIVKSLPIKTLIDIGANTGQFSLLVRGHHENVKIIAFEPLSAAAQTYSKVFSGDEFVQLHQCAIGQSESIKAINISASADSSSILEIAELQNRIFPGTHVVASEQIKVVRFDKAIEKKEIQQPALLKIDVQGYELEVLESVGHLFNYIQWIYVEVSFQELYVNQPLASTIIEIMFSKGYFLSGIYNGVYDSRGISVQADLLFEKLP